MGVASERAVSIPQITYDHIDDSEEKKDVTFFQDEQRGSVEGNIPGCLLYYEVNMLISWRWFFPLRTRLEFRKHHRMLVFWKHSQPVASTTHEKAQPCFQCDSAGPVLHRSLTEILLWNRHLRMPCSLRSVLFRTLRGHLAAGLVSRRGHSVLCDGANDDCWEASVRLLPVLRFYLMTWCILNIVKSCLGKALEFPLFQWMRDVDIETKQPMKRNSWVWLSTETRLQLWEWRVKLYHLNAQPFLLKYVDSTRGAVQCTHVFVDYHIESIIHPFGQSEQKRQKHKNTNLWLTVSCHSCHTWATKHHEESCWLHFFLIFTQ